MKHTKEEILNALHIIKDTCQESTDTYGDCLLCPFSDGDGHCIVAEQAPSAWDIVEKETWRAFE
jgi:hypothetical protein